MSVRRPALPALATTGIGSLPHADVGRALQVSLMTDIPFLAQLPRAFPEELMVPAALEGVPGLRVGEGGQCRVDVAAWRAGEGALAARLRMADVSNFEPSPRVSRCFQPFLAAIGGRGFAKVQLAGPVTVCRAAGVVEFEIQQQIGALLLAKSLALVRAVQRVGVQPIIFLDEPWLSGGVSVAPLRPTIARLQGEGAIVGLHCCGEAPWSELVTLGLDVLSFDAERSLQSVLEAAPPSSLCLSVGVSAQSHLQVPRWPRLLVTPRCGLAFFSEAEALAHFEVLAQKVKAR